MLTRGNIRELEELPMNHFPTLTSEPLRRSSASGRAIRTALGAIIATCIALAVLLLVGIVMPGIAFELPGVGLCGLIGALTGALPGLPGRTVGRIVGGAVGGLVAGWFAIAAGEMATPGTLAWAYSGGALALLFALPVACIVGGVIGILSPRSEVRG
jgi:hypothetical protein